MDLNTTESSEGRSAFLIDCTLELIHYADSIATRLLNGNKRNKTGNRPEFV